MQVTVKQAENSLSRVAATQDGQILLAMLCKECGFLSNLMDLESGERTLALAAVRGVYAKFRKHIPRDSLIAIEHDIEFIKTATKTANERK